jgi:hypothetical protein
MMVVDTTMRSPGRILPLALALCGGCHLSLPYAPAHRQDAAVVGDLRAEEQGDSPPSDLPIPADIGVCPDGQPRPLFHSSFEDPGFGEFSFAAQMDPGDSMASSAENPHWGTHSAQCVVGPPENAIAAVWRHVDPPQLNLHARIWIYLPESFSIPKPPDGDQHAHGWMTVLNFVANGQNLLALSIRHDNTLYLWNTPAGEAYGYLQTTTLTRNRWHWLEMQVAVSESAGQARLWLDGRLETEATGINIGPAPVESVSTGIYWGYPLAQSNTIYVDDLSVDTEFLGPCR